MSAVPRPTGVTILSILGFLGAIGIILIGIGGIVLAAVLIAFLGAFGFSGFVSGVAGLVVAAIGGVILILGLIFFLISWGLWSGKNWARLIWIFFSVLGILGALGSLAVKAYGSGLINLIIDGLIVYYLTRPHVSAYFHHTPIQPMMQQPPSK